MNPLNSKEKIASLLARKARILKLIEQTQRKIQEEGENEDAWPGHGSTLAQDAQNQLSLLEAHLESINQELKKLGLTPKAVNTLPSTLPSKKP